MMAVTLYTSRVILQVLGVDDYGIYNLVAGFVTLFSFISRALTTAIQRFLNVALGRGDTEYFRNLFSTSINIFFLFSIIVLIIGETIGVWFVDTQLNIPNGRMDAAKWVFRFSLWVFILGLIRTPYNAAIIAHEKMDFYAYVSIFEVLLKLGIVFMLQLFAFDKLILYGCLFLLTMVVVSLTYYYYCRKNFLECKYRLIWDKLLFKELLSFSGWSLVGQMAVVGRSQGESYFINHYHSVAVNAAQGVSNQVTGALNQFVSNFQTAFNPQLVQTYAAGEMHDHVQLLYRACKFSYFLLLLLVVPVVFNIDVLLSTWLTEVPAFAKEFCVLGFVSYLVLALSSPMTTTIFANGRIKNYQIALTVSNSLGLVLSFVVLKLGFVPYSIVLVSIIVQIVILFIRLFYSSRVCPIGFKHFITTVLVPVACVTLLSGIVPSLIAHFFTFNIWFTLVICGIDVFWVASIVFIVGLNKSEKVFIKSFMEKLLHKQN